MPAVTVKRLLFIHSEIGLLNVLDKVLPNLVFAVLEPFIFEVIFGVFQM